MAKEIHQALDEAGQPITDTLKPEEEIRRRAEELHVLHEVDRVLQRARTVDALLEETLSVIVGLAELEVESKAGVFLVDDERKGLCLAKVYGEGFGEEFLDKEAWIPMGACLCGRAAVSGDMILSDNCFKDPRHEHRYQGMTAHGHYIIPLKSAGNVLGVMFLYTDPNPHWDHRRVALLESIGGQIGIAVERLRGEEQIRRMNEDLAATNQQLSAINRRMKSELEAAARVQQALLPTEAPNVAEATFAWTFKPCDSLAGDMFNVFQLDKKNVGLYLLDVSGHGVAAALLSVTLSRFLSPLPSQTSVLVDAVEEPPGYIVVPPAWVAQRLNHRFPMDPATSQYFTLLYGLLNLETCELRYVAAGHPGPVYVARDSKATVLDTPGYPIGMIETPDYEDRVLGLHASERVYFYSDGITETLHPQTGELFGEKRLVEVLQEGRGKSLGESLSLLLESVEQWSGASGPRDDVSALALEITRSARC